MAIRFSYDETVTRQRAAGETIFNIDFKEAALLQLLDFSEANLNKIQLRGGWPNTKIEWFEDVNTAFSTTLAEGWNDSDLTGLGVTDGSIFRTGDILGIFPGTQTYGAIAEKFIVTSVSTNDLSIRARGYGDTSAATHASGATIINLTRAVGENASYTVEKITSPTAPYNYTQILDAAVEMTRTEMKLSRYGIDDHLDMQVAKLFDDGGTEGRLAQLLHRTFYYGERVERANTTTAPGTMGGFHAFVTTSSASTTHVQDLAGAVLTKTKIHEVLRAIRMAGGMATHLVHGGWGAEKLRMLYEDKAIGRTVEDRVVGSPEVETLKTPHGEVKLIFDWMCPEDSYYFINADKMGWVPFDNFERTTVYGSRGNSPTDGQADKVVGEFTFVLASPKSHGVITGAAINK
jgi:hypothetical protein